LRCPLEVIEQASSGSHEFQKTSPGGVIFAKDLEVIGQLIYPTGQQRDLDICTPSVLLMQPKRAQIYVVTRCHNSEEP